MRMWLRVISYCTSFSLHPNKLCSLAMKNIYTVFMFQKVTTEPFVSYWNPGIIPYSRLQITVKAFTYWGASPQVQMIIHSPPSVPTKPTNPRVFVAYSRNPMRQDQVCGTFPYLCDSV